MANPRLCISNVSLRGIPVNGGGVTSKHFLIHQFPGPTQALKLPNSASVLNAKYCKRGEVCASSLYLLGSFFSPQKCGGNELWLMHHICTGLLAVEARK